MESVVSRLTVSPSMSDVFTEEAGVGGFSGRCAGFSRTCRDDMGRYWQMDQPYDSPGLLYLENMD